MVDTEPPVITSINVSPGVLQPPDGRMIPVTVSVSATDNMDPSPVCAIATVLNSEAPSMPDPDIAFTGAFTVSLRAFRFGAGDGRTYTITASCTDDAGNASTAIVSVLVPHDSR